MKNGLKKAAVLGLSTCLVLGSLAGCSKKETFDAAATAVTVNGDVISAGLAKFATHYTQAQMEEFYASMGASFSQDLGTGATLGDMVKDSVITDLEHKVLAEQKMAEYGVELTEDEKAAAVKAAAAFIEANDAEVLGKMGATQETVERFLNLETIQVRVEAQMIADVDTEVADEEAAQRKIQYALFVPSTEEETEAESETEVTSEAETAVLEEEETVKTQAAAETETDAEADETETETAEAATEAETETETEDPAMIEAKAEALAKAESLLQKIKAGEDFKEAAEAVDPDAACATMTFGKDDAYIAPELVEATEGLADGVLIETPIETDRGCYVAQIISELDREATDAEKENIVKERKSARVSELYTEWMEAGEITTNDEVLAKIVFDFSLMQERETEAAETEAEAAESAETETEAGSEAEAETETAESAETEAETAEMETEAK